MATTSLCLLMLVLTPWMANGRPAEESAQSHSRDSRQMLLPFVPMYQPYQPSYQNYGNPMGAMTPAAKRQLLQALLATSSALSSQSLDHSGFKTALNQKNDKTPVDSNTKKPEFDAGTILAMDLQGMGLSPELFEEMEGRMTLENLVSTVIRSMTTAVLQMLIQQLAG